jgi:hypothetical protein
MIILYIAGAIVAIKFISAYLYTFTKLLVLLYSDFVAL